MTTISATIQALNSIGISNDAILNNDISSLPLVRLFAQTKPKDSSMFYWSYRQYCNIGMGDKIAPMSAEKLVYIGRAAGTSECLNHKAIGGDVTKLLIFMLNSYANRKGDVYGKSEVIGDLNRVIGDYSPDKVVIPVTSGRNSSAASMPTLKRNDALLAQLGISLSEAIDNL